MESGCVKDVFQTKGRKAQNAIARACGRVTDLNALQPAGTAA